MYGIFEAGQKNVNLFIESYLDHMNSIFDVHAPFKKLNKYILRFKIKSWITPALKKSTSVDNSPFIKFINCNDCQRKENLHTRYKDYRNLLSILLKGGYTNYYNNYFEINWNNIKNTWKCIKSISSVKIKDTINPLQLFVEKCQFSNQNKQ